jgi:hypothetical protein
MSDTAPLQLACRFCRPLVEGRPSVFEVTLSSIVPEPVRDIVLEFRCAGLRGGVAERSLTKPLTAFEVLTLDMDIDPERKGTPPMTVHLHASTSRERFTARKDAWQTVHLSCCKSLINNTFYHILGLKSSASSPWSTLLEAPNPGCRYAGRHHNLRYPG